MKRAICNYSTKLVKTILRLLPNLQDRVRLFRLLAHYNALEWTSEMKYGKTQLQQNECMHHHMFDALGKMIVKVKQYDNKSLFYHFDRRNRVSNSESPDQQCVVAMDEITSIRQETQFSSEATLLSGRLWEIPREKPICLSEKKGRIDR